MVAQVVVEHFALDLLILTFAPDHAHDVSTRIVQTVALVHALALEHLERVLLMVPRIQVGPAVHIFVRQPSGESLFVGHFIRARRLWCRRDPPWC